MRRIRYVVACSLDGYIAGPKGEADWIIMDPDIDFGALFAQFDTLLIGRRTWEGMPRGNDGDQGMKVLVFSRTLRPEDHPGVTIVVDDADARLRALRAEPGRDIWLFGGGELFRSLLGLGQVDTVEVAMITRAARRRHPTAAGPGREARPLPHRPPGVRDGDRLAGVRHAARAGEEAALPPQGGGAQLSPEDGQASRPSRLPGLRGARPAA